MHIEVQGYFATAAAVAGTAAAACNGDTLTVKNARIGSKIVLVDAVAFYGSLGELRVVGPHMNDTTQGIRMPVVPAVSHCLMGGPMGEPMWPQDTLVVTMFGTAFAAEVDVAGLVFWYEDLPGITARMIDTATLRTRGVRVVPVNCTIATVATGQWGAAEALNADSDLLRPNTDYALVGGKVSALVGVVGVRSPDWGNVRVPIPGGIGETRDGSSYLSALSDRTGLPCIPILNSGNKAGIFVDMLQDEAGVDSTVSLNLVELAP